MRVHFPATAMLGLDPGVYRLSSRNPLSSIEVRFLKQFYIYRGKSLRMVFPKIGVFPPKSCILIGFSIIKPSILGVFPLFLGQHPLGGENFEVILTIGKVTWVGNNHDLHPL